jgi:hypothetical protein
MVVTLFAFLNEAKTESYPTHGTLIISMVGENRAAS